MKSDPDLDALDEQLFPRDLAVATADAVASYGLYISRLAPAGHVDAMLAGHASSLASPDLNAIFRTATAIADVEAAAAQWAPRMAMDPAEAAVAAIARYKRGIAEQLAAVDGHDLQAAAKAYLAACAQLDRAEADERRQHELEAAERRRQEALEQSRKREAAEAHAAEVRAAREKAATVESQLEALHREHRRVRLQWLRSELQALGVDALRVSGVGSLGGAGSFFGRGRYSVALLIDQLNGMSTEQLTAIEHAVSAELERQEAQP